MTGFHMKSNTGFKRFAYIALPLAHHQMNRLITVQRIRLIKKVHTPWTNRALWLK